MAKRKVQPMESMLAAVLGHYDSRGGTTAMPIQEPTEAAVREAITKYNKAFGWEETLEDYNKNPESWGWDPTKPDSSPGDADFMYIARLHYPAGADMDGDLENVGVVIQDDSTDAVFREEDTIARKVEIAAAGLTQLEFIPLGVSRYESQGDIDDDVWTEKIIAKARVVKGDTVSIPNWNDDAFGFIVGTGM